MSNKTKTDSKSSKSKTTKRTPEVKERKIRESRLPEVKKLVGMKVKDIEAKLFAAASKADYVPFRGGRGVIARGVVFPIQYAGIVVVGAHPPTFPSTKGNPDPTYAQGGSHNVCAGDLMRGFRLAGMRTINLNHEKLPAGVVLASEKFPRKSEKVK